MEFNSHFEDDWSEQITNNSLERKEEWKKPEEEEEIWRMELDADNL